MEMVVVLFDEHRMRGFGRTGCRCSLNHLEVAFLTFIHPATKKTTYVVFTLDSVLS